MWIIALLGMATNYAEAVMAQKTRVVDEDGTVPVSYTHLDVYKRQRWKSAPAGPSTW